MKKRFYPPFLWLLVQNLIMASTSQHKGTFSNWTVIILMTLMHTAGHVIFVLAFRKFVDAAWAQALYQASGFRTVTLGNTILFCFLSNVSMFAVGYWFGTYMTVFYLWCGVKVVKTYYNEPVGLYLYIFNFRFSCMKN